MIRQPYDFKSGHTTLPAYFTQVGNKLVCKQGIAARSKNKDLPAMEAGFVQNSDDLVDFITWELIQKLL
jgi:hypothetical protein